ncbi:hypothetical protein [Streptomyces sp. NPDC059994]|uniref:hypothetical protein n=1 Tax=Streptomyces sp. NPDC059994 TaxID=3347029 RepID=UPI0036AC61CA
MDVPCEAFPADDLESVVASITRLLDMLGMARDEVLDVEQLAYAAGLSVGRVQTLLDDPGAPDPEEGLGETAGMGEKFSPTAERFRQRLAFLRATRLRSNGQPYTLAEIGAGSHMSGSQVSLLLIGRRRPTFQHAEDLGRFYKVPPGFFSATDSQALHRVLKPIEQMLLNAALYQQKGITQFALRSRDLAEADPTVGAALRDALTLALTETDSEVREISQEMLSLPAPSRRRVLPQIKRLLGRARMENEGKPDPSPLPEP